MSSSCKSFYIPIECEGHLKSITDIKFSGVLEGKHKMLMVTTSQDGKTLLRSGVTGDWLHSYKTQNFPILSAAIDEKGTRTFTCGSDAKLRIYNNETFKLSSKLKIGKALKNNNTYFNNCQVNNRLVAVSASDNCVYIFDESTNKNVAVLKGNQGSITNIKWLSSANRTKSALIKKDSGFDDTFDTEAITDGGIDRDGLLLTTSTDNTIRLWSLMSMKQVECWEYHVGCKLAYNKKLNLLASVENGIVDLIDVMSMSTVKSHGLPTSSVNCMAFDGKGEYLVCGTDLCNLYKIDLKDESKAVGCIPGHSSEITCCEYSPDDHVIASGSQDGMVKLWQNFPGEQYGLWNVESKE